MGRAVDALQIQSIDDGDLGYINALSAPHVAAVQRQAQIAQSQARQAAAEAEAAGGLSRANVNILNGADGIGEMAAGLVA